MKQLSTTELLTITQDLVAIESVGGNPAGLRQAYQYMVDFVRESGKDITIEEFDSNGSPSFLAYRGQERPANFHIILNGHLDVVPGKPEQYQPYIQDGKLYGRGVYDMKAACVILAQVFCEFVDKVPYALGLQMVTDEETGGKDGTLHQIQQGIRGNFIICGDCGRTPDTYEIANEAKGVANVELCFRGDSSHGAYPWRGDNAALKAANFVRLLHERYPTPPEATDGTTLTVTAISAVSDAYNKTPDYAVVRLDGRYVAGDPHFKDKAHIAALIQSIDPAAEMVELHTFLTPLYTNPESRLLLQLKVSAERVEGMDFSLVRRNGTSDAHFYQNIGSEACEFGLAGEHQHANDEHITIEAFQNYLATMRNFLAQTVQTERHYAATDHLPVDAGTPV